MSEMFCYQCQETAKNTGCTVTGVCGKKPDVARAQDFLIWLTKGLSELAIKARAKGLSVSTDVNHQVTMNLFTTITNANFDRAAIEKRMKDTIDLKKSLLNEMTADERGALSEAALWDGMDYESKSYDIGVLSTEDENIRSLRELTIYGLKGLAAYTKHANVLLAENEEVDIFIQEALTKTMDDSLSVDDLVGLVLETGTYGVKGMALLDGANSGTYGNPEITEVNIGVRETRPSSFPAMICVTWKCCWSKLREPALTSTPIRRCFRPTIIQRLRNMTTLWATTATHGGNKRGVRQLQRSDSDDDQLHRSAD